MVNVGDMVFDRHYGHGIVKEIQPSDPTGSSFLKRVVSAFVHFPNMAHMASCGNIRLVGRDQLRALKVVSSASR